MIGSGPGVAAKSKQMESMMHPACPFGEDLVYLIGSKSDLPHYLVESCPKQIRWPETSPRNAREKMLLGVDGERHESLDPLDILGTRGNQSSSDAPRVVVSLLPAAP